MTTTLSTQTTPPPFTKLPPACTTTTTTCQPSVVRKAGEPCCVTHPAAQIEVPAAHLLEERKPGAQDSCLGSRLLRPGWSFIPRVHDPLCPTPAPVSSSSSSFTWPPQILLPCLRRGEALLLLLAASLLHFSSFFVCFCLGSFLHCVRVCCWACVVCVHVCLPSPLSLHLVPRSADHCSPRFWH